MSIPLLTYTPTSQNHRVATLAVPGDEHVRSYTTESLRSASELDTLIQAAYLQIFHEQQMLSRYRQTFLESQLTAGQISVREFIRGLALSDSFRRLNYDSNNNYRFVQLCVQRILGRDIYSDREKLAWSIVLATQGLQGFIDALVNSEEYLENFGETQVPYQRQRILPQRSAGEVSFAHTPRYGAAHLAQLKQLGNDFSANRSVAGFGGSYLPPKSARQVGAGLTYALAFFLLTLLSGVILSWFGLISI